MIRVTLSLVSVFTVVNHLTHTLTVGMISVTDTISVVITAWTKRPVLLSVMRSAKKTTCRERQSSKNPPTPPLSNVDLVKYLLCFS